MNGTHSEFCIVIHEELIVTYAYVADSLIFAIVCVSTKNLYIIRS